MWTLGLKTKEVGEDQVPVAGAERFSTLWFDDDLDGKIKNKNPERPARTAAGDDRELHDLYDNNADDDTANLEVVWQLMTNTDGSPNRGDFGKVDLMSPSRQGNSHRRPTDD